ncbi:PCMD domain-containing protein [uncultured Cytophaga sp.]|mgnify:CR=1 FL=1|uniref:PCMD domain-containing protein n=1 Tax=uncultured Cytophaga sp. TaxID=160238 RepID=UPI00261FF414|nr:PCMD domain-containing protein [uncultured Cytophaga sp.]
MKKLYILLLCGISTHSFGQQLANSDFENWTNHPGNIVYTSYKEVNNWASGNAALDVAPGVKAPTSQTTDAQNGTYAVKLTTQTIFGQLASGNLFTGKFKLNLTDPIKSAQIGTPYSSRPTAFNVYYKYASVKGDSCSMYALLTKYNTSTHKRDTIGLGSFVSSTSVNTYTLLNMPITYTSTEDPDSISMVFSSSADGGNFRGQVGSTLTIDNFSLDGVPSLSTTASLASISAVLYPNPAQSRVVLSNAPSESGTVYFYNVSGSLVRSQKWIGTRTPEFELENMPVGFYTCKFITSDETVFASKLLITE